LSRERLDTATRRRQITAAALEAVNRGGMRGVTLAAVARRVGVVPSACYRHFRGKQELLDSVIELLLGRMSGNVGRVRRRISDPIERLRLLLFLQVEMILKNPGFPGIIFNGELVLGNPERRERIYRGIMEFQEGIAGIIREGQAAGLIREDRDPETAALNLIGIVQPGAFLRHLSGGIFDLAGHARRSWEVFSASLRPPA